MSLVDNKVGTKLEDLFIEISAYSFFALTLFCLVQINCRDRNSCTVRVPAAITTLTTTITENMQYACSSCVLTPTADALSHSEFHNVDGVCLFSASNIVALEKALVVYTLLLSHALYSFCFFSHAAYAATEFSIGLMADWHYKRNWWRCL